MITLGHIWYVFPAWYDNASVQIAQYKHIDVGWVCFANENSTSPSCLYAQMFCYILQPPASESLQGHQSLKNITLQ